MSNDPEIFTRLGRLEGRTEMLEKDMTELTKTVENGFREIQKTVLDIGDKLSADITGIKSSDTYNKGIWKGVALVGSAIAGVASVIYWIWDAIAPYFGSPPH